MTSSFAGQDDYFDQHKFDVISKAKKNYEERGGSGKEFERLLNRSTPTGKLGQPNSIERLEKALDESIARTRARDEFRTRARDEFQKRITGKQTTVTKKR